MTLQEIEAAALELSREERLRLAQALTDSVQANNSAAVDAAWIDVAAQRLSEINQDKDVLIDGDEAMRRAHAALNTKA